MRDNSIQSKFKKKLKERFDSPQVNSGKLSGFKNHYKIKFKTSGYRLVYEVIAEEKYILVITIGKRDKSLVVTIQHKRCGHSEFMEYNQMNPICSVATTPALCAASSHKFKLW